MLSPPGHLAKPVNQRIIGHDASLPILPDGPAGIDLLNFRGLQAFVFSVVPLSELFIDDMGWEFGKMLKQKMERSVGANPRRDEDGADVLGIDDFCGGRG